MRFDVSVFLADNILLHSRHLLSPVLNRFLSPRCKRAACRVGLRTSGIGLSGRREIECRVEDWTTWLEKAERESGGATRSENGRVECDSDSEVELCLDLLIAVRPMAGVGCPVASVMYGEYMRGVRLRDGVQGARTAQTFPKHGFDAPRDLLVEPNRFGKPPPLSILCRTASIRANF